MQRPDRYSFSLSEIDARHGPSFLNRAQHTLHDWLDAFKEQPVGVEDALALDVALEKLAAQDERQAKIVEMRFFGGLSVPEVAEALGVSTRTVEGEWTHARAWLKRELSKGAEAE